MTIDYTYAVSRIRSRELDLFSNKDLETLLSQADYDRCLRFLYEKGWGDGSDTQTGEELLKTETRKIWQLMGELVQEDHAFDVFLLQNDFHNLKVAIKAVVRDIPPHNMFIENGTVEPQRIYDAVAARDYYALPEHLQAAASEAVTTLLQTSDGQLCDVIVDNASLQCVYKTGMGAENEIIRLYAELLTASADIKIAVRCCKTNKSIDFIKRALVDCGTLNADMLASAAAKGFESIYAYLEGTEYKGAVDMLRKSPSAFEKWCDDLLTEKMQSQKWEPFTIGPLIAYIIARENEIKAVRIILSGKLNALADETIKERLRDMYV